MYLLKLVATLYRLTSLHIIFIGMRSELAKFCYHSSDTMFGKSVQVQRLFCGLIRAGIEHPCNNNVSESTSTSLPSKFPVTRV